MLSGALYVLAPGMILHPRRASLPIRPEQFGLPYESVSVTTPDSVVLRGYWIRDTLRQRPVIIIVHGSGNCKESQLATARWLWMEGFSTLLIDLRAHGTSGGKYCTYGHDEKVDVTCWVDALLQRDSTLSIGIWGNSLGGAVALQSLAYDNRLQYGIIESTFADFRTVVYEYQKRIFKLPLKALANSAATRAGVIAGFSPDEIRPEEAAFHIRQPIFLAHGTADRHIPFSHGRLIFEHLASADKQFYPVPGATHHNLHETGGSEYTSAIAAFLKKQNGRQ